MDSHLEPPNTDLGVPISRDSSAVLAILAILAFGGFVWLYSPTFAWLVGVWRTDEYYSHGLLLPLVSLYLLWEQRPKIQAAWKAAQHDEQRAKSHSASLLLWGLGLQFLANVADVNFLKAFSIPLVMLGVVRFVAGEQVARIVRFPILYLMMAVPLSGLMLQRLCVPMQNNAASWASVGLGLLGIPIVRDGVNLYTPHYRFVVAVPCSGLNTAITLVTLSVLVVHLLPDFTNFQRCVLCILSIPIALLANTLRISTIVLIGHFAGLEAAEGFFHNFSGLFIFVLSFCMLVGLSRLFKSYKVLPTENMPEAV